MLNIDLRLDWWWLYFQVIVLVTIIVRELIRARNRNLYAIVVPGTMLVLVQGQAWWMLGKFEQTGGRAILHLSQVVSLQGLHVANLYLGLSVVCFAITYALVVPRKRPCVSSRVIGAQASATPGVSYVLAAGWTLGSGALLLWSAGGLQAAVSKPGQALVGGLTMFLLMTGLGKLPLLRKVALRHKINRMDLALFVLALFLILINSRFLAAFIVLQVALLLNYCSGELPRRALLGLAFSNPDGTTEPSYGYKE